jgi:hypothetical protein
LIIHICNGHETMTVTTANHQSREMAVSLGPQRTLVMGTNTKPVTVSQHQRHVLETASPMYQQNEMGLFHVHLSTIGFVTGIKQQPLPQLVTAHVKMTISLGLQGTLVMGTKTEPVTVKSISETRVVNLRLQRLDERAKCWGPLVSTGNGLLRCPLNCWHFCNRCSN